MLGMNTKEKTGRQLLEGEPRFQIQDNSGLSYFSFQLSIFFFFTLHIHSVHTTFNLEVIGMSISHVCLTSHAANMN